MVSDYFLGPDGHFEIGARLLPDAMVVRGQIIGNHQARGNSRILVQPRIGFLGRDCLRPSLFSFWLVELSFIFPEDFEGKYLKYFLTRPRRNESKLKMLIFFFANLLIFFRILTFRNCVILIGHWLLHGFGILAITQLKDPDMSLSLLCLTPLPAIFYCFSSRFSDPVNFSNEMNT